MYRCGDRSQSHWQLPVPQAGPARLVTVALRRLSHWQADSEPPAGLGPEPRPNWGHPWQELKMAQAVTVSPSRSAGLAGRVSERAQAETRTAAAACLGAGAGGPGLGPGPLGTTCAGKGPLVTSSG